MERSSIFEAEITQFDFRVIDFEVLEPVDSFPLPEGSLFARLQEKAKLSIFTEEFLVSEAMNMSDRLYEMYVEKKHARAEGLAEGRAEGLAEGRAVGRAIGRTEGIDILESLGVSSDLIEKARKIAAEKAKESPSKP